MWVLVGVDSDGAKHRWNDYTSKSEAQENIAVAMTRLEEMRAPYIDSLKQAEKEYKVMDKEQRFMYSDYLGWKMQGFYVDHFVIEERD
jgi:hypothetical protein